MKFIDRIYVDDARINSYAEQASLRSTLRKFPDWLSEISLSIAKVSLKRSVVLTEQSRSEKIAKIVKLHERCRRI